MIDQLQALREEHGDLPVCIETECLPSGQANAFRPATFDVVGAVESTVNPDQPQWVALIYGNTTKIVAVL